MFEAELERAHAEYRRLGVAMIRKLPVPTAAVGGGHRVLSARQCYDFEGVFGAAAGPTHDPAAYMGRMLAMESKASEAVKASLPIVASTRGTGLSYHQLAALVEAHDWGAVAVLVWLNGDQLLVLGGRGLVEAKAEFDAGGRRSIHASAFTKSEIVDYPCTNALHDWLYTVRCALEVDGLPGAKT